MPVFYCRSFFCPQLVLKNAAYLCAAEILQRCVVDGMLPFGGVRIFSNV